MVNARVGERGRGARMVCNCGEYVRKYILSKYDSISTYSYLLFLRTHINARVQVHSTRRTNYLLPVPSTYLQVQQRSKFSIVRTYYLVVTRYS